MNDLIDIHAHVLPGVDDGPWDEASALELLRCLEANGVTAVVATPHTLDGRFDVSRQRMLEEVEALGRCAAGAGIGIRIHPGAEVPAQPELAEQVRLGHVTTLADSGRYLLLEMSFQVVPPEMDRLVFELQVEGLVPILAHPERTLQVQMNPSVLDPLVEAGTLVQINAASLTGDQGEAACAAALALVDRGTAHLLASDAHDAHRRPPRLADAFVLLKARLGEAAAEAMVCERPRRILAGEAVEVPPPARARKRKKHARQKSWWPRIPSGS